ncbi:hypothetical protein JCM31826_15330 [Thermaurantimonas aggregans]|uniref:Uncharacterized protein n=2 Tax=Thermaurantimonas aggregans TaxID=2173829 RepID=A0A401XM22_9FLAO|nr:hypothetical protein [Thermaurantimonas aggregans]MCX8148062.1 hypothetical protein [Thermaurantimonas aggregans]GCD78051.1 hypothetical protein JCM31826_15330 [Thermaurantimonas aggregans]
MVKHECGGAFGQALATEAIAQKGEVFYVSKNNASPKPIKVSKDNTLVINGAKGEVKIYIAEKILTDVELASETCDRWRKTPDASVTLQKGKHIVPVYFEVRCNPCILPKP